MKKLNGGKRQILPSRGGRRIRKAQKCGNNCAAFRVSAKQNRPYLSKGYEIDAGQQQAPAGCAEARPIPAA
jgi:hypothetical protein